MVKVGVVLSGCGVMDGTEVFEAVALLLALDREGAEVACFAPDMLQTDVINHLSGQPAHDERNVLVEAGRLVRGEVQPLAELEVADIDALAFPGGFGAAKNLSSFATAGADCRVEKDVARVIRDCHDAGKPVGVMCIAPVLVASVLGEHRPQLTIGNDAATAQALEAMGARHVACAVDDVVVDESHKLVSTPAYMLAQSIGEAAAGITRLAQTLVQLARS